MKKRGRGIAVVAVLIACLIIVETTEGSWKDTLLKQVAAKVYEDSFLIAHLAEDDEWLSLLMGHHVCFEKGDLDQRVKNHLIYMENTAMEVAVTESGSNEKEIQSSGDSTVVVSGSLQEVLNVNPGLTGTAGTVEYVKRLWENKDVNYLWNHFYIIDSTTSVKKNLFPVEKLLTRDLALLPQSGKKQILIYHTHGASELFSDSRKGKGSDSIIGVGSVLAEELEKQGYGVYHDKTKYDWIDGRIDRSQAYNASLSGIQKILQENPDIQVTIDLHRDAVGKGKHTYTIVDGKKTAMVMFFNGLSRSKAGKIAYLENPNLEANLAFSLQLKCHAMELYDGFSKPIYLKGYRYNLHVKERALLVELGNENNTVEEAKNAAVPLARVIADVLRGEKMG